MKRNVIIGGCCLFLVVGGLWFLLSHRKKLPEGMEGPPASQETPSVPAPSEKIIDYEKIKEQSDKELAALMEERKAPYGVQESVDMIVKSDEAIKVGEETVQMQKIVDEIRLEQGEILETDLETGMRQEGPEEFGIHVVQPNENIWDIHFELLRDYYHSKGIEVAARADEPDDLGYSSGVGKILKFSENLVYIYNLRERKLEPNLDLIYPMSKIVIYNMSRVFALLDGINYADVERIEFDGKTLWLPAEQ